MTEIVAVAFFPRFGNYYMFFPHVAPVLLFLAPTLQTYWLYVFARLARDLFFSTCLCSRAYLRLAFALFSRAWLWFHFFLAFHCVYTFSRHCLVFCFDWFQVFASGADWLMIAFFNIFLSFSSNQRFFSEVESFLSRAIKEKVYFITAKSQANFITWLLRKFFDLHSMLSAFTSFIS